MNTKHTPGPWKIKKFNHGWAVYRDDAPWQTLIRDTEDVAQKSCDIENEAYRKHLLEVAAPDMLAALEQIVRYADGGTDPGIFKIARAAIAKATGEA
jgi:hypothetical protein